MTDVRVVWRMAKWWQCAIMIAFAVGFGWIIRAGLRSTGPGARPHVMVPPFGLWLYATLATLVNRRSVIVTPEQLVIRNGPLVVRARRRIAREEITLAYFSPVMTVSDGGSPVVLWYTTGIETRGGAHVELFGTFKDGESARASAQRIADALGPAPDGTRIEVRALTNLADDPAEKSTIVAWVGVTIAALIAGFVWDVVIRSP